MDQSKIPPNSKPLAEWVPSPPIIIFYIYAIVVFQIAWTAAKSRTRSAISDPKPNLLYVGLASIGLPFYAYEVFWTYFAYHNVFEVTGQLMNFLLTIYLPFRFLFPVNSDLENFKSGGTSAVKTWVFIASIFFDFALSIGTIVLIFSRINIVRIIGIVISVGGFYYIAKTLQQKKVRWSDVSAKLAQIQWAFFALPLGLATIDFAFSKQFSFWLAFHGYLVSFEALMMFWILKTFGS